VVTETGANLGTNLYALSFFLVTLFFPPIAVFPPEPSSFISYFSDQQALSQTLAVFLKFRLEFFVIYAFIVEKNPLILKKSLWRSLVVIS
jgi:hypothetical protein